MTGDGVFDADVAATYDAVHVSDPRVLGQTVETLKELAAGGAALEFAIGTGRIALPLHDLGVTVSGIEMSKAMVAELRKKASAAEIAVVVGDMVTTKVPGDFSLVFLVYNTIDNLTTQEAQLACFENASAHLKPGGRFLIETLVPPLQRIAFGETKLAFARTSDHWGIDEFDVVTQQYSSHHVRFENGSHRQISVPFRYAWPSEMDLMARAAGLEFESRWADWQRSPFTNVSKSHISVWCKPLA